MTDTFNSDQENKGTTDTGNQSTGDNTNATEFESGNRFQQQIDVMQKRIGDKDAHISSIESENQILREKLASVDEKLSKMGTVEEALSKLKDKEKSNQDTALDEDTIKSMMRGVLPSVIKESTEAERAEANFKEVSSALTKTYGADKVDEVVAKVAIENGMSFDDMLSLARKSPKVVFKMVGIQTGNTNYTPTKSTSTGYGESYETKEQKLAYYSKLRREDPKSYYSPAVQKKFREVCLSK